MGAPIKYGWMQLYDTNNNGNRAGGLVLPFTAAATLNVGDWVYISTDFTVNKSTSAANHAKGVGVVVGGTRAVSGPSSNIEYVEPIFDPVLIAAGVQAAQVGESVLVCVLGVAYVITAAAIAAGVAILGDTGTAGRVKAAADITATAAVPTQAASSIAAGATPVTSTAANGAIITAGAFTAGAVTVAGDGFFRGAGRLLEASGGAGEVKRALILAH